MAKKWKRGGVLKLTPEEFEYLLNINDNEEAERALLHWQIYGVLK